VFYLVFFSVFVLTFNSSKHFEERIIKNALYFITASLVFAEILSFFGQFKPLLLRVLLFGSFLVYGIFYLSNRDYKDVRDLTKCALVLLKNHLALIVLTSVLIISMLVSGLIYFPTNHDANVYHLPRIIIWLQQGSLNHFETPVYRMVYQPYLTEIIMTFIYVSYGPVSVLTLWSMYMLFYVFMTSFLVTKILPAHYRIKGNQLVMVIFLCWSILLQCTTTLNDIQLLFHLLLFYYFLWKRELGPYDIVYLFLTVVLAYLTKGTFGIYFLGSMFIWTIVRLIQCEWVISVIRLFRNFSRNIKWIIIITLLVVPSVWRNIQTSDSLLGVTPYEKAKYTNEYFGLKVGISNTVKNIAMHSATPVPIINDWIYNVINEGHKLLALPNIDDVRLNWAGLPYNIQKGLQLYFYPETISNTLLFYLTCILIFVAIFPNGVDNAKNRRAFIKINVMSLVFIFIFSFILRWQPWHTRLLMPVFLLQSYGVVLYLSSFNMYKYAKWVIGLFGIIAICLNANRPVFKSRYFTSMNFSNMGEFMSIKSSWEVEMGYTEINRLIGSNKNVKFYISDNNTPMFGYMYTALHTNNAYGFERIFENPTKKYNNLILGKKVDFYIVADPDENNFKSQYFETNKHRVFNGQYFKLYKII
jgi:hypothetical protein